MFRHGFLYQFFKLNQLKTTGVSPLLEEVQKFQMNIERLEAFESDQDEWDTL